jgi:hypothetical protein
LKKIAYNGLPLCEVFRESLLSKKNLAKRVMGERRAKATMVSHRPRSGSPMGKIVPKGDFSHLVYRRNSILDIYPNLGRYVNVYFVFKFLYTKSNFSNLQNFIIANRRSFYCFVKVKDLLDVVLWETVMGLTLSMVEIASSFLLAMTGFVVPPRNDNRSAPDYSDRPEAIKAIFSRNGKATRGSSCRDLRKKALMTRAKAESWMRHKKLMLGDNSPIFHSDNSIGFLGKIIVVCYNE